uniref:Uncharacterized protein n=1 Tax=Hucho hucho TaxID=62062 RepID=A0A4W5N635_9TELE
FPLILYFSPLLTLSFPLSSLQYSAVDSNPLSVYVMHPFWNSVVKVRTHTHTHTGYLPGLPMAFSFFVPFCEFLVGELTPDLTTIKGNGFYN